eukprot:148085-Rhodomonas_salina.2
MGRENEDYSFYTMRFCMAMPQRVLLRSMTVLGSGPVTLCWALECQCTVPQDSRGHHHDDAANLKVQTLRGRGWHA